jgi:restriction endonuclease Mrr
MDKGKEFENIVAELFERSGWRTETRKRVIGRSGTNHEIDIYGERGRLRKMRMVAECKFKTGYSVSKGEVSQFLVKIDDIGMDSEAYFITNSRFSSCAERIADTYGITLLDNRGLSSALKKYGLCQHLEFIETYRQSPLAKALIETIETLGEFGVLKNQLK